MRWFEEDHGHQSSSNWNGVSNQCYNERSNSSTVLYQKHTWKLLPWFKKKKTFWAFKKNILIFKLQIHPKKVLKTQINLTIFPLYIQVHFTKHPINRWCAICNSTWGFKRDHLDGRFRVAPGAVSAAVWRSRVTTETVALSSSSHDVMVRVLLDRRGGGVAFCHRLHYIVAVVVEGGDVRRQGRQVPTLSQQQLCSLQCYRGTTW